MRRIKLLLLIILVVGIPKMSLAQDSSRLDRVISFPDKLFGALERKAGALEEKLNRGTAKYLAKMKRQEEKLKRKLAHKDSLKAEEVFGDVKGRYQDWKNLSSSTSKYASAYSGRLDSLTTSLQLLQRQGLGASDKAKELMGQYQALQQKLNLTEQLRKQILQRQAQLKQALANTTLARQLRSFQKQVYYYQAQVREYRQLLEDPSKWEAKLLELAMKLPQFRDFFARNSGLGRLFALPVGNTTTDPSIALAGLQTRASVAQSLQDRFGSGPNVTQQLQQSVQSAQGELNALKNKYATYGSGSYGNGGDIDQEIPGFKPNQQKTRSFLQRLEYGANVQNQKARYFFPVTSDLGLSIGYKLNDNSSIGIGASYKLGWGRGWDNIQLTHQGVGLRSYLDWKLKGSFYLSGGYEQNYRQLISTADQLRDFSSWQRSGLVGLSKKYKLSGKLKGEMKLLWDFLSYQQVPKTQAILFRIGYSLK